MTVVPVSEGAARRTIGDILLAHGFVSEGALAEAAAEQARTAQPLGQILVTQGVITRLELASALAEQWSDPSASITLLPRSAPGRAPAAQPHDDAQYAARLQDAVADLARRVHANKPLEGLDERVNELSQRIEATLARTQWIEATVATLAEGLEGVTTGVEDAFAGLQAGTADLARELARIDLAVVDLSTRPVEQPAPDPLLVERLGELQAAVDALAERPVADEAARGLVEELSSRLETLVDAAALDDLRSALSELEGRPAGDPELAARLECVEELATDGVGRAELEGHATVLAELRAAVAELEARPAGNPDLDGRLERLEAQLAEGFAPVTDTAAVDALQARVEEAVGAQEAIAGSIEVLTARLEADAAAVAELREAVAGVSVEPVLDPALAEQTSLLAARVEQLAADRIDHDSLVAKLEAVEARLGSGLITADDLSLAIDRARDELAPSAPQEPDGRIEQLADVLDAVRRDVSALAGPPAHDPVLGEKVETIAARVEQLAAARSDDGALAAKLAFVETRLDSDLDTIDVLARAIDRIREELASPATAAPGDTASTDEAVARLEQRLSTVDERLAAMGAPRPPATGEPAGAEDELERLRMAIERVGLHVGEHDRALSELMRPRGVTEQLEALSARIDELVAGGTAGSAAGGPAAPTADVMGDMRALMQRVEEAETSSQADRERLLSRLERMASSIDWRLQRLETDEPD